MNHIFRRSNETVADSKVVHRDMVQVLHPAGVGYGNVLSDTGPERKLLP